MEGAVTVVPPEGASTTTESASWLELEAVQLVDTVPVLAGAAVEPAPPEEVWPRPQRLVWPEPGVRTALLEPLLATETSQEPAVATETFAEMVVPEVAELVAATEGALWVAPFSEIDPALMPLTAPPKVTAMVLVPEAGLRR